MKIHLHIGMPKTGSSAIQQALHASREPLLAIGVRVAQTGLYHGAHHGLEKELRRGGPGALWDEALAEAKPGETLVISAEGLWFVEPEGVARLAQRLRDHAVMVHLYLRRPDEFLASLYRQRIKGSGRCETLRGFLDHRDSEVDYPRMVSEWSQRFKLRCCGYESVRKCVIQDFAAGIGVDPQVLTFPQAAINATPSDGALRVMWWWNRLTPRRVAAMGRRAVEISEFAFRCLGSWDESELRARGMGALKSWKEEQFARVGIPLEILYEWRASLSHSNGRHEG